MSLTNYIQSHFDHMYANNPKEMDYSEDQQQKDLDQMWSKVLNEWEDDDTDLMQWLEDEDLQNTPNNVLYCSLKEAFYRLDWDFDHYRGDVKPD